MTKACLAVLTLCVAATGQLCAGPISVTLIGANGETDSSGYLISPYNITIGGVASAAYCDDFANTDTPGETWQANETNLANGNLSNTRYGNISQTLTTPNGSATYDGQQLYEMAAWLTTQYGSNAVNNGKIQDTIWDLFNPNAGDPSVHPPVPGTNTWLFASEASYGSIDTANFNIVTNISPVTLSGAGQVQELLVAPEPATMLLLGLGLMAVAIGGRRAMKRFGLATSTSLAQ
jgi:hypothetical protein